MPYAQNGEISIYYDTYGEPAGPALVFAHGAGGNAASWWQQVPVFSADHHVVVFDHRGFGRSVCPPEQQSAAHYEADVASVMDAAGIDRAVIVCQSMGGWTGVRMAVYRTERVGGVLLGNTPGAVRTEVTVANRREMAERLAEAGGLINRAYSPEFAERHPAGAVLYRQISAFNTQARPNTRDDAVYVEPGAVRDSGRSVPGPLKRSRSVVPTGGPRIRSRRHWRATGAGRRCRTLHIFRETRGIQRHSFGVPRVRRMVRSGPVPMPGIRWAPYAAPTGLREALETYRMPTERARCPAALRPRTPSLSNRCCTW